MKIIGKEIKLEDKEVEALWLAFNLAQDLLEQMADDGVTYFRLSDGEKLNYTSIADLANELEYVISATYLGLYRGTEPEECLNDQDLLALSVIRPLAQRIVANKEEDGSTDYLDAKQLAEWTEWLCKRHL